MPRPKPETILETEGRPLRVNDLPKVVERPRLLDGFRHTSFAKKLTNTAQEFPSHRCQRFASPPGSVVMRPHL